MINHRAGIPADLVPLHLGEEWQNMSEVSSLCVPVQERWFTGPGSVTPEQQKLLRALPIFEAAAPGGDQEAGLMDLLEDRFLAPEGADKALLGPGFLKADAAGEAKVLIERLGVKQLTQQELIADHVLPRYDMYRCLFIVVTLFADKLSCDFPEIKERIEAF